MTQSCRQRWGLVWSGLLLFLLLACGPEPATPAASETTSEPVFLAVTNPPEPSRSRQDPLPPGSVLALPNWQIEVLEMVRGEEAAGIVLEANMFNELPPPHFEVVLLKLRVSRLEQADAQNSYLSLALTGDRHRIYDKTSYSVVSPEPRLNYLGDMTPGSTVEGWTSFAVGAGEQGLLLSAQDADTWGEARYVMALATGNSQQVPSQLDTLMPSLDGETREQPAQFGNVVTTENWQIRPARQLRGDDAWQLLFETNQFNDPPPPGMSYVAITMTAKNISAEDELSYTVSEWNFRLIDDNGVAYDPPAAVNPVPDLSLFALYPGGETSGWIVLQMPAETQSPLLLFIPPGDYNRTDVRFISLLESGR